MFGRAHEDEAHPGCHLGPRPSDGSLRAEQNEPEPTVYKTWIAADGKRTRAFGHYLTAREDRIRDAAAMEEYLNEFLNA